MTPQCIFSITPWRTPLARALHHNRSQPNSRYLQLATLTVEQRPTNRTVVFRGFLDHTNQLKFVTDARSAKVKHIQQSPWSEACWYFPATREQFRIAGQLSCIDDQHQVPALQQERLAVWQTLSDHARAQFVWPMPGSPRQAWVAPAPLDDLVPATTFCLLLLEPNFVDHLELREDPHHRCQYCLDALGTWSVQFLNP